MIRIKRIRDFEGEDVVLLAADGTGIDTLPSALADAQRAGWSRLPGADRVHDFVIEAGAAHMELWDDCALWRLDPGKATEIVEKLRVLSASGRPGHHYVDDMSGPAPTLVLSRDEYLAPSWLTAGRDPLFGGFAPGASDESP
ncbi:hypothetical protein [Mycobacterium colombiense]|uniref:hypothetical protein n=1 Tax=Mycobacterium colombiense TaxID=339268 RepID=UPI0007EC6DE8|nr:hypothetical protein [Mycobacterium colombiense]OBJ34434.1 hypothetical protein A5620_22675 [Mycobacterium colombiense]